MSEATAQEGAPAGGEAPDGQAEPGEWRTRTLAGLTLVALALGLAALDGPLFAAFVAVAAGLMMLEWVDLTKLAQAEPPVHLGLILVVGAGFCVFLVGLGFRAAGFYGALGLALAGLAGFRGRGAWAFAGILVLALPAEGLLWLRAEWGLGPVLWLFAIVWAADTGAMAAGRGIGGPAFAPALSPNKTWAGLGGGLLCGQLAGLAAGAVLGLGAPWSGAGAALFVAAAALLGDMGESALKRHAGVKSSGSLIPGHGGVLDRLDSLLAATAVAVGLALLHPAA